jgi:hypothetical protein
MSSQKVAFRIYLLCKALSTTVHWTDERLEVSMNSKVVQKVVPPNEYFIMTAFVFTFQL